MPKIPSRENVMIRKTTIALKYPHALEGYYTMAMPHNKYLSSRLFRWAPKGNPCSNEERNCARDYLYYTTLPDRVLLPPRVYPQILVHI